jgi:sugar phosphate permease
MKQIFIIEGLATVVIAICCFFFLIDSPSLSSSWLEPDEIRYLELRQLARRVSRPSEFREKHFEKHALISVLTDWKIYLLIFANWSNAVPNYALKFTMPQIIKNMGFTSSNAQLLTIPPYAVGALASYGFSVFADRYSWRMPFIVAPQLCLVVSFAILFSKAADIKNNIALCYFAVCLSCFGLVVTPRSYFMTNNSLECIQFSPASTLGMLQTRQILPNEQLVLDSWCAWEILVGSSEVTFTLTRRRQNTRLASAVRSLLRLRV